MSATSFRSYTGTFLAAAGAIALAGAAATAAVSSLTPTVESIPYPGGRPPSAAEVALGRQLFFETRLSSTETISCATCHKPERGLADGERVSTSGVTGVPLKRHTPHLYNLAWGKTFFWDGRSTSLEDQALGPIRNPLEMGLPGDVAADRLKKVPYYVAAFEHVYPKSGVAMKNVAKALSAFERTLVSNDAPFDRYEAGDKAAMSTAAVRGRQLFFGRARCSTCHSGPNFTDDLFHNTGVISDDIGRAALDRVGEFQMRPYPFFQMRQAFKTPSLRNVALTAPYQHNGSEAALADVVRLYNLGGRDPASYGKALDIRPLNLPDTELADLVAFLEALTSPVSVTAPARVDLTTRYTP